MSERAPIDSLPLDHPEVLAMKEADAKRWAEEDRARAERLKLDGGPAFPSIDFASSDAGTVGTTHGGMSLRDYFAAKVLGAAVRALTRIEDGEPCGPDPEDLTKLAYEFADCMLRAREEQ